MAVVECASAVMFVPLTPPKGSAVPLFRYRRLAWPHSRHQVQVAVAVHVPERDGRGIMGIGVMSVPLTPLKGSAVPLFRYRRLA